VDVHGLNTERELERIFELSLDSIVVVGFDGYLKRANAAVARSLGYTDEELLGRRLIELVHPDDRERAEELGAVARRGETLLGLELRYVCKDGSFRWLQWSARPVVEEQLIYAVARDVTERRAAEAELRAAEERHRALAAEQAALRRVATLVARELTPGDVFAAVAEEVGRIVGAPFLSITRFEADGTATEVAGFSDQGAPFQVGTRWALDGPSGVALVRWTGRAARINDWTGLEGQIAEAVRALGIRSTVGIPIVVAGRLWGAMVVSSTELLPDHTEARLADFTELVATAIANAESRAESARLLDQQAALRRVATLVARAWSPTELFAVVVEEVRRVLDVPLVTMARYEPDGTALQLVGPFPAGTRWSLGDPSVLALVWQTRRPARIDDWSGLQGQIAEAVRALGIRSSVGIPIVVAGRLWGAMVVSSAELEPLAEDTKGRLADFTELVATAIANAEARSELIASRARVVTAADETRRRIERDLHDGAQQRLVSLGLELRMVESSVPPELPQLRNDVEQVADGLVAVLDELQEMSRGIHPAILSTGGLAPALHALAERSAVPVELEIGTDRRLPEQVEVAAYYLVSEALTNGAKHAQASVVHVGLAVADGMVRIAIRDDGVGGADPAGGSGLIGIRDRVEALGGTIELVSPAGRGTSLSVTIPLGETPTVGE
jgi:PAS domain S-box-containing protein